jgi:hypothetical protein
VRGEFGSDLEGNRLRLFQGGFVDDICQVRLFRAGRATGLSFFSHLDGCDAADRSGEMRS